MKYNGVLKISKFPKALRLNIYLTTQKWFVYTIGINQLLVTKFDRLHNSEGKRGLVIFRVGFHNVANVFYFETQLLFNFLGIPISIYETLDETITYTVSFIDKQVLFYMLWEKFQNI